MRLYLRWSYWINSPLSFCSERNRAGFVSFFHTEAEKKQIVISWKCSVLRWEVCRLQVYLFVMLMFSDDDTRKSPSVYRNLQQHEFWWGRRWWWRWWWSELQFFSTQQQHQTRLGHQQEVQQGAADHRPTHMSQLECVFIHAGHLRSRANSAQVTLQQEWSYSSQIKFVSLHFIFILNFSWVTDGQEVQLC